jgi:hypothetical protein
MRVVINVNKHVIQKNNKYKTEDPPITVRRGSKKVEYTDTAVIKDKAGNIVAEVVYRPNDPLPCGGKVLIEVKEGNVE